MSKYGQATCKRCGTKGLTWVEGEPGRWFLARFDLDELGNNIIHRAGGKSSAAGFYAHTVHTKKMCDWYQSDKYQEQAMQDLADELQRMVAGRDSLDLLLERLTGDEKEQALVLFGQVK